MMVSIIVITLAMVSAYLQFAVDQNLEDKIVFSARQQAKLVGAESLQAIIALDGKVAHQIIQQYSQTDSVQVAAILLADNKLLGYYTKLQGIPLPVMDTSTSLVKSANDLIIAEPVFDNKKQVGFLFVQHDLDGLLDQKPDFLWFLIILAAFMLVLSFLLAGYFQKILTYPVSSMVRHITDIYQSKNFDKRLEAKSDDEIGQLIKGFNHVLDATQYRENELTARGKQLQKLVDVRTKQLFQKAHYDSLTGLPNRYLLVDRLHQAISKSARNKTNIALLFLDLDRFKIINDNFGHQNGDQLLKEVAKRLKQVARSGDTVARLGGDEFVFLLENLAHAKSAARSALRIIECFSKPFQLQEHILHISTSIGISVYPDDCLDDKVLLKNADISMYHAKKKGPGNFSYYSEEMNNTSLERLAIESKLRDAIKNNELSLVYQPQKRLKEARFRNAEALLRWNNPELGNVSPGVFIPIAEETGLIKKIDLWVISKVCRQIKQWNAQGLKDITIAINVSAGHLISRSLLEHIKTEIIVNQIKAEQLEIEITEEVFVEQTQPTIENLKAIKKLGARIAIDDFGTGYSSLQYLQDFPADTLKLDGMFIRTLETDRRSQGIVRSTIILAHSLGLELVAECVEEQWQLDFLTANQCDLIQGFLFSKPIKAEDLFDICMSPQPELTREQAS